MKSDLDILCFNNLETQKLLHTCLTHLILHPHPGSVHSYMERKGTLKAKPLLHLTPQACKFKIISIGNNTVGERANNFSIKGTKEVIKEITFRLFLYRYTYF
jgi:hypothetical protein